MRCPVNWPDRTASASVGRNGVPDGIEKTRGRRRAVRVTGGIMAGFLQFKRLLSGVFEEDESVRYATSIAEADSILDNW